MTDLAAEVGAELQKRELEEYEQMFDLRRKTDMRAIKRWQEATGRTLVWPDHADLCVWLLEENERLRAALRLIMDAASVNRNRDGYFASVAADALNQQQVGQSNAK